MWSHSSFGTFLSTHKASRNPSSSPPFCLKKRNIVNKSMYERKAVERTFPILFCFTYIQVITQLFLCRVTYSLSYPQGDLLVCHQCKVDLIGYDLAE